MKLELIKGGIWLLCALCFAIAAKTEPTNIAWSYRIVEILAVLRGTLYLMAAYKLHHNDTQASRG